MTAHLSPVARHRATAVSALVTAVAAIGALAVATLGSTEEAGALAGTPAQTTAPARSITIGWVGDVALGSRSGSPPDAGRGLLAAVRRQLRRPDLMIGNLEGVIGTGGTSKCAHLKHDCFAFEAPPATAKTLAWAGFDVMNLANNHSYDYGATGQRETLAALRSAGLRHTGLPGQIAYVRRRGIRIAIVGLAPYPWSTLLTDTRAATALVRRANRHAGVVVAVIHAGAEGANALHVPFGEEVAFGERRGNTRAIAHALVDAGADLVVGSGPHVIRGVERYHGSLIAYSAGDFAGYHTFSLAGPLALSTIVTVRVGARGHILGGRWASLRLAPPGAPAPDPKHTSAKLAAWLSKLDFAKPGVRADGRLVAPHRVG